MPRDLKDKLLEAGMRWRKSLRDVGNILQQLEQGNEPIRQIIHEVLYVQCRMPKATAIVSLRWAKGELGSDEEADTLISRVTDSKLAKW